MPTPPAFPLPSFTQGKKKKEKKEGSGGKVGGRSGGGGRKRRREGGGKERRGSGETLITFHQKRKEVERRGRRGGRGKGERREGFPFLSHSAQGKVHPRETADNL